MFASKTFMPKRARLITRLAVPQRAGLSWVAIAFAAIAASLALAVVDGANAYGAPPASHYTVGLSAAQVPSNPSQVTLTAQASATSKTGSAAGMTVDFYLAASQFAGQFGKAPLLLIGTAKTNASGVAAVAYSPTWKGAQSLSAALVDSSGNTLATGGTSYTATTAAFPFKGTVQSKRPDGSLGQWVGGILLGILAILWLVLFGTAVRVNLIFKRTSHRYAR